MYGHADALLAPAIPGHRDNTGVGKLSPPMVPSVPHSGDVSVPKWSATAHDVVQEGARAEETSAGSRWGTGAYFTGVQHLWAPPGDGNILQIPGEVDLGGGWRLDLSDTEFGKGVGGVEEDYVDP